MLKYRNKPTEVDGIRFSSAKEARRYSELKFWERAGGITKLILQPRFPIMVNGVKVCTYVGDFEYYARGERFVEDAKGMKTPIYRLKAKLFEACYGFPITEV